MQWQRVFHGCGAVFENAGKVHSVYEFTVKSMPGEIVRIRVVETPEGQFYGLPSHVIVREEDVRAAPFVVVGGNPTNSPEKALHDALCHLANQVKPPFEGLRLVRLQSW